MIIVFAMLLRDFSLKLLDAFVMNPRDHRELNVFGAV